MIQAVIWDWNGTLLNDLQISYDILNLLLKRHGFACVGGLEGYRKVFGFPIKDYYLRAGFNFDKVSYEDLAHEYTIEYAKCVKHCQLHENAIQTLSAINKLGLRQVILSASEQSVLQEHTELFGVAQYFDELVGTNNIYAAGKLQAGLLWKEQNHIESALLCGDTLHDLEVANALSVKCVLFDKGHHTREALINTKQSVISSLSQIINLI